MKLKHSQPVSYDRFLSHFLSLNVVLDSLSLSLPLPPSPSPVCVCVCVRARAPVIERLGSGDLLEIRFYLTEAM